MHLEIVRLRWREPLTYDVFDPDGSYVGRVRVPHDTRIVQVRANVVWGVATDSEGVHTVKPFRIAWSQGTLLGG
jgi:hypothetical protein